MNEKLTMQDLITFLASKQEITENEAALFIDELFAIICETLIHQESVCIKGFGTFKLTKQNSDRSNNLSKDEGAGNQICFKISFTPDTILNEAVNKPFACFESVLLEEGVAFVGIEIIDNPDKEDDSNTSDAFFILSEPLSSESILVKEEPVSELEDSLQSGYSDGELKESEESDMQIEAMDTCSDNLIGVNPQAKKLPIESVNEILTERKNYKAGWIVSGIIIVILLIFCTYLYRSHIIYQINDLHWDNIIAVQAEIPLSDTILNIEIQDEDDTEVQTEINNIDEEIDEPKSFIEVKYGDTLRNIGLRAYGNKSFWVYIYQDNIEKILDFNNVPVGTVLRIPANKKYGIDASNPESVQKARNLEKEYFKH